MEAAAEIKWNGYSLAERDWRWRRVRDNAAKAGFDCIFVPLCVDGRNLHLSLEQHRGTRSDCRFLTILDNAAVILPTESGSGRFSVTPPSPELNGASSLTATNTGFTTRQPPSMRRRRSSS